MRVKGEPDRGCASGVSKKYAQRVQKGSSRSEPFEA